MRLILLLGVASLVAACFDPHDPEFSGDAAPGGADAASGSPESDGAPGPTAAVTCGGIAGVQSINDEAAWIGGNIVTVRGGVDFNQNGYLGSRWAFHMEGGRLTTAIEPTVTSGIALELLSPWEGSELVVKVDITGVEVELRDHGSVMSTGEGDHDGDGAAIEISVEDGLLRVASAPIGETPVVIFEQPAPTWVRSSYLLLERFDYLAGEAAPRVRELVGHGPGAAPCKAEELVDPFDALDPITWRWTDGCTPTANGMLSVPIGGGSPSTCFVRAHYAYKLRGSRAALELPNTPGVVVALRAWNPGTNKSVRLAIVDDELRLLSGVSSPWEVDETIELDTSRIRWLALKEAGGQIHWETSADGVTWDDQYRTAVSLDLEHVVIGFDVEDDIGAGTAMIQGFGH